MENLSPALEDYLKKIYRLSEDSDENIVHVNDLALRMGVSKAYASRSTSLLSDKGMVQKNKYRGISLTTEGRKRAAELSERHHTLRRFFSEILRVDPDIADMDACKIEHGISAETYRSIRQRLGAE
ncbi:MAG: metal-dependent transcriptional regulator [Clostridiales Family XIII bacterium]|jgi:Mn-dependent DtxR family transcriptional regulator|nr:metal-dependent transcriptional regulator [Clostridiales Family XIII bacterium]